MFRQSRSTKSGNVSNALLHNSFTGDTHMKIVVTLNVNWPFDGTGFKGREVSTFVQGLLPEIEVEIEREFPAVIVTSTVEAVP